MQDSQKAKMASSTGEMGAEKAHLDMPALPHEIWVVAWGFMELFQQYQALVGHCIFELHDEDSQRALLHLGESFLQVRTNLAIGRPEFNEALHYLTHLRLESLSELGAVETLIQGLVPDWRFEHVEPHYLLHRTDASDNSYQTWKLPFSNTLWAVKAALFDAGAYVPADVAEKTRLEQLARELFHLQEDEACDLQCLVELTGYELSTCQYAFGEICAFYSSFAPERLLEQLVEYLSESGIESGRGMVKQFRDAVLLYLEGGGVGKMFHRKRAGYDPHFASACELLRSAGLLQYGLAGQNGRYSLIHNDQMVFIDVRSEDLLVAVQAYLDMLAIGETAPLSLAQLSALCGYDAATCQYAFDEVVRRYKSAASSRETLNTLVQFLAVGRKTAPIVACFHKAAAAFTKGLQQSE